MKIENIHKLIEQSFLFNQIFNRQIDRVIIIYID